jgi:hypothetical protein
MRVDFNVIIRRKCNLRSSYLVRETAATEATRMFLEPMNESDQQSSRFQNLKQRRCCVISRRPL